MAQTATKRTGARRATRNRRQPKYPYILRAPGNSQDGTFKMLYADQAKEANRDAKKAGEKREWVRATRSMNPTAFDRCVADVEKRGGAYSPRGVCAAAGRKKFGKKKFQAMALAGKRKASNRPEWDYWVVSGLDNKKEQQFTGATARAQAIEYAQQQADSTGWSAFVWRGKPGGWGSARSKTVKPRRGAGNPQGDRLRRAYLAAYRAAQKADDKFQAALVKQHGKRAGDERYKGGQPPAIERLGKLKRAADEKMRKALDAMRAAGVSVNKPTAGINPSHVATLREGQGHARIMQDAPHSYSAEVFPSKSSMQSFMERGFKKIKAAMAWARLKLHEVSNPKGVRVRAYSTRKNPLDAAQKMTEEFHGFPSTEVREYFEEEHHHSFLAGIGPLVSFDVVNVHGDTKVELLAPDPEGDVEDVVFLGVTEDGKQLMLKGGDQEIPLKVLQDKFGMNKYDEHDYMLIGTITQLTYRTRKTFEQEGAVIDFYHDLGKEHSEGILPVLVYKPRNKGVKMEIVGGRYFIGKPERELGGVSPGIVG